MKEEQQMLLLVRGTIASQTHEDQEAVKSAEVEIRAVLAKYPGGHGQMAIALLGAELAAAD